MAKRDSTGSGRRPPSMSLSNEQRLSLPSDDAFVKPAGRRSTRAVTKHPESVVNESMDWNNYDWSNDKPSTTSTLSKLSLETAADEISTGEKLKAPIRRAPPRMPKPDHAKPTAAANTTTLRSSSVSSLGSIAADHSSNYETPGTSTVATPAESGSRRVTLAGRPRVSAAARAEQLRSSRYSLSSAASKRKRVDDDDEVEEDLAQDHSFDALLARSLQEEENANAIAIEPLDGRRTRKRRSEPVASTSKTMEVEDSLDDDVDVSSDLSSAISLASAKIVSPIPRANPSKRGSKLPSRAARDSARKSIAKSTKRKGIVEEDEADLGVSDDSDYDEGHELISDTSADSDDDDDEDNGHESDIPLVARVRKAPKTSRAGSSRASASRAGRRARAVASRRSLVSTAARGLTRAEREKRKLEHHHPEVITMWKDLKGEEAIVPVKAEQPTSITRPLKSFQLEGLDWMIRQERTKWKGGLLGDEMGMGKTIQAVSLIMSDFPAKAPTLVVVPPVALIQWQNEINEYTNGKLKILVFHGIKVKKLTVRELKKYDVLMTSYSTLEAVFRKERKGWSRVDQDDEKVLIKEDSPLHAIHFHRIILDEAHSIKSRNSGTARACYALNADYRWCLSGTPLQNRIGEFFSLFRFLGIEPFACYMCKACACKEVHWAMDNETRRCKKCKHRGFDHVSLFNLELLDPIVNNGHFGEGIEAYQKLQLLTGRIMLRRLKADHTASMELPPKNIVIHNEFFGEVERDFARSVMANTNREFDTYVAQGVMLNNYANIFGLIMQMRQVADHPDMILKKKAEGGQNVLVCAICDDVAEDAIRSTCRHDFCRACVKSYIKTFSAVGDDPACPRCHIPLSIDLEQEEREQDEEAVKKSSIINRIKMENWTSSTKIEMLVYELAQMRNPKRTTKSIVFSQFTSMLQLVEWRLRRAGFNTVMLDGSMTPVQRQSSIDYFMKNPDVEVFLVSLKAGGVALNLTEASKVYIIDPWWNPAAEWQSADRCHRIGQRRPCEITRLVIEDSVESRMVLLQEKKARMIQGTINSDERAMQNLAPEDMQFLFRGA